MRGKFVLDSQKNEDNVKIIDRFVQEPLAFHIHKARFFMNKVTKPRKSKPKEKRSSSNPAKMTKFGENVYNNFNSLDHKKALDLAFGNQ